MIKEEPSKRLHFHSIRERHSYRWWLSDLQERREISGQFALFFNGCGAGVRIGHDEHAVSFDILIPYVLGTFVSIHTPLLYKAARALADLWPTVPGEGKYVVRETEWRIHSNALWWSVWAPEGSWHSKCPKWRHGSWHPLGHGRRMSEELIKTEEVEVPMPERTYRATATLSKCTSGYERLPRLFDREWFGVEIKMHAGEQIPHPGKGENSWDCGEDATYSMSTAARSIEEGIGQLVGSVLRSRRRHGGRSWRPAPKAPPAAPATPGDEPAATL